jgi:hypothetical protein
MTTALTGILYAAGVFGVVFMLPSIKGWRFWVGLGSLAVTHAAVLIYALS